VPLPRWAVACATTAGLAVLVLAVTADPAPLLTAPTRPAPGRPPGPLATATATATAPTGSSTARIVTPYDAPWVRPLVLAVLAVVALVILAGTAIAVVQVARRLWADRWQAPDLMHAIAADELAVDLTASWDAVADEAEHLRRALRAGTPRNGVVQCWLLLVHVLEQHGVHADPAQSPTELTRQALTRLSTDRAAVRALTGLFLEARFSEHPIGEAQRQRAEAALDRVVAGLGERVAGPPGDPDPRLTSGAP
jgi:hypothetical protein